MVPESDNRPVPLGRVVRGHWLLIAATTLAGLVLGFLASTQLSERSSATATVLLNPLENNPFYPSTRGENLVNLGTEAQALRSDAVAALVVAATSSDADPKDLLANLTVTNPANTQILEVSYDAAQADDATTYSQAFADAYLTYRRQRADTLIDGQITQFDQQISTIQTQLNALAQQIANPATLPADAEVLRQQSQNLASQLGSLTARRADLQTLPRDPGQIVTPATPDSASPLNMGVLLLIAGGAAGAAAGLAIAMARTVSDRRIHTVDDIEILDIPVLGVFGTLDPTTNTKGDTARLAEEQVRRIRAALLARQQRPQSAILITGATYTDHAPLVVAELAGSLARSGLETLVLHATLHADQPQPLLPAPHPTGLGQLLLGRCSISDATIHIAPMLSAIPLGELGEEVADLFIGEPMRRLVNDLRNRCDILLISADPISDGAAQSLTGVVDSIVLEIDQHTTTRNQLTEATRTLAMLTAQFDGAILTGPQAETWAQNFRPHLTMMQRQLGTGTSLPPPLPASPEPPAPAPGHVPEPPPPPAAPSQSEHGQVSAPPTADDPRVHQHSNGVPLIAWPAESTGPSGNG